MSKEAGIIDDTPILGVSQSPDQVITEGFSPDDETSKTLADLSEIFDTKNPDSTTEKPLPLINYGSSTYREPSGRVNFHKPNQRPQGVGFSVLNQFSDLSHQNSPLHK